MVINSIMCYDGLLRYTMIYPPVNTHIYIYIYTHDSICTVSIIIQINRPLFIFPIDCSGIVYPILWNLPTLLSNTVYPHQWSPVDATNHYFPLSILDCWWFNYQIWLLQFSIFALSWLTCGRFNPKSLFSDGELDENSIKSHKIP